MRERRRDDVRGEAMAMRARLVAFGDIEIDGVRFAHDVVVDRGTVRRRRKGPSKPMRDAYGHTPLSAAEEIPWGPRGSHLLVGTGADAMLPIADDLWAEADRRGVDLIAVPTDEACRMLSRDPVSEARAILHVTC